MELEKVLEIKDRIEKEKMKETETDIQTKKDVKWNRKVYEANISSITKVCIYQTSDNEFYLLETEKGNENESNLQHLYDDERKLTLEQAVELGGENIESYFKEMEITQKGTLLRDFEITGLTAGYYETIWDSAAYELEGKCYFIEKLYEVEGDIPDVSRTWWKVKGDEAPKVHEVSRQEMESKLGRTIEELKRAREIWEKGDIVEGTDTDLRIKRIKKFQESYAGYDLENSYSQFREMTEEEVLERIEELNRNQKGDTFNSRATEEALEGIEESNSYQKTKTSKSRITLKNLAQSVKEHFRNMER